MLCSLKHGHRSRNCSPRAFPGFFLLPLFSKSFLLPLLCRNHADNWENQDATDKKPLFFLGPQARKASNSASRRGESGHAQLLVPLHSSRPSSWTGGQGWTEGKGVPSRGHRRVKGTVASWVHVVALPQATMSSVFLQGERIASPARRSTPGFFTPWTTPAFSKTRAPSTLHPICGITAVRTDTAIWQLKLQRPCCARLWHKGSATCQYTFPAGPNCRAYAYCWLPW